MDTFCTLPARKFEIICLTTRHQASFCLLCTASQLVISNSQVANKYGSDIVLVLVKCNVLADNFSA